MNNNISIASSAMLVEVSISSWTARKLDKGVSDEVNKSKNADKDVARVNKSLLAGAVQLKHVNSMAGQIRHYVNRSTMPWSDSGPRLLPTASFVEFKSQMDTYEAEFNRLVTTFLTMYPTLVSAQAFKLGSMFNRDEFPSVEKLERKFSFRMTIGPVPEFGDFRIDIGEEAATAIRSEYDVKYKKRLDLAMDNIRTRLHKALNQVSDRLGYEGGKKKHFQNTLVDNLNEVLVAADLMNLVDDPKLKAARDKAAAIIATVSPEELRKNDAIRDDVKSNIDDILSKFVV
jgi:hypothetical protein